MTANDRDAAHPATESDEAGSRVVGDTREAREARYREAIWGKANTNAAARAVMAVADAEQARLKAEVEQAWESSSHWKARAERLQELRGTAEDRVSDLAEELSRFRADVEALAYDWDLYDEPCGETLRAALAAEPAEATASRPRRYDQCDDTCTTDCGHCKGTGRPAPVAAEEGGEQEAGEVVHDGTGAVDGVTRCCGERMTDLPPNERVTMFESQVTCQRAGDEPEPLWDCFICGGRFPSGHGHSPAKDGSDEQGNRPATPDANGVHDTKGGGE